MRKVTISMAIFTARQAERQAALAQAEQEAMEELEVEVDLERIRY